MADLKANKKLGRPGVPDLRQGRERGQSAVLFRTLPGRGSETAGSAAPTPFRRWRSPTRTRPRPAKSCPCPGLKRRFGGQPLCFHAQGACCASRRRRNRFLFGTAQGSKQPCKSAVASRGRLTPVRREVAQLVEHDRQSVCRQYESAPRHHFSEVSIVFNVPTSLLCPKSKAHLAYSFSSLLI